MYDWNEIKEGMSVARPPEGQTVSRPLPKFGKGAVTPFTEDWKITEEDIIRILRVRSGEAFACDDMVRAHKYRNAANFLEGTGTDPVPVYRGGE